MFRLSHPSPCFFSGFCKKIWPKYIFNGFVFSGVTARRSRFSQMGTLGHVPNFFWMIFGFCDFLGDFWALDFILFEFLALEFSLDEFWVVEFFSDFFWDFWVFDFLVEFFGSRNFFWRNLGFGIFLRIFRDFWL